MSISRYIPNTITSMNLVCGIIGVVFAFEGRQDIAFIMMLASAVFDFLDGLSARALGAYSEMGKELDSLCDQVSFGVLPSVMMFSLMKELSPDSCLRWTTLAVAVFGALRLAKFNVDERQHMSFIGLPTPACAILCGAICHAATVSPDGMIAQWCSNQFVLPALSIVLCILLVCGIPMISLKFSRQDERRTVVTRIVFACGIACCGIIVALTSGPWSLVAALTICWYILLNVISSLFTK